MSSDDAHLGKTLITLKSSQKRSMMTLQGWINLISDTAQQVVMFVGLVIPALVCAITLRNCLRPFKTVIFPIQVLLF